MPFKSIAIGVAMVAPHAHAAAAPRDREGKPIRLGLRPFQAPIGWEAR